MNNNSSNNNQQQESTGQQQWFQPPVTGTPVIQVPPYRPSGTNVLPQQQQLYADQVNSAPPQQNYGHAMPPPPGGFPQDVRNTNAPATCPPVKQKTVSSTCTPVSFNQAHPPGSPGGFPQPANNFQAQNLFGSLSQKLPQHKEIPMYNNQHQQEQPLLNGPPVKQTTFNGVQQTASKNFGMALGPAVNGLPPGPPPCSPITSPQQPGTFINEPPQNVGFSHAGRLGPHQNKGLQNTSYPGPPLTTVPPIPPINNGPPVPTSLAVPARPQYNDTAIGPGGYQPESPPRGSIPFGVPVSSPPQVPPLQDHPTTSSLQGLPQGGPAQARRPMYPAANQQSQSAPQMGRTGPQYNGQGYPNGDNGDYASNLVSPMAGLSVREGMNKLWGVEPVNLLQERDVLNAQLPLSELSSRNCSPDVMRCTMVKVPETSSLLQKSRLPLGILLQPFKDLQGLPVLQVPTIVRCRACRTYINPFIQFIDRTRWKCNICFRLNDLPADFLQDPVTGRFGDPELRPEIKHGTVEYIAPTEYMVRPPQAATYLFVMDVSFQAVETGYLKVTTDQILECLDHIPGDGRTTIGFITFDSAVHFYSLDGGSGLPRQMVITDVNDVFIPTPEDLLCNLNECREQVRELLLTLGKTQSGGGGNCLGAALQAAYKLLAPVGGRVSVFQCCLPNLGPGALQSRENPNERSAKDVVNLNPATDFYKKLALDCSGQQIGVDLFLLSSQFADLATLAGISKFSSGHVYYYSRFHVTQTPDQVERFSGQLRHYLTRKVGFESVMRIRCTKGLQLHTFHGNFFVRSTDLLSLPTVNPDTGYAMQVSIEENLTEYNAAVFQAAVLYTSSQGERRIRVHTLCLPVSALLPDILQGADQEAVVGLLAKMAVDRSLSCSVSDARDALINAASDLCHAYSLTQRSTAGGLMIMPNCKTLPLYVLGLLKQRAFRVGVSTKLDDRIYDMELIKNLPLDKLLLQIYPALYPLHLQLPPDQLPPRLQLSFEKVDKNGLYLLETIDTLFVYVGGRLSPQLLQNVFGVSKFSLLPDSMTSLPELSNENSERIRDFVSYVGDRHTVTPPLRVIREDSQIRQLFTQYMVNDRGESVLSYYEFLQHLRNLLDSY